MSNFVHRGEIGHLIDLKVNVVGQKETVLRIRVNGMAQVVLERSSVVELAVVLLWRVIGDVIAVKRTMVGASGVNTVNINTVCNNVCKYKWGNIILYITSMITLLSVI